MTAWDDGAARPIPVNIVTGQQLTFVNGPLVFLGFWLKNAAGATTQIAFFDGAAGEIYGTSITSGGNQTDDFPDRGILVETELQMSCSGGGPVTGSLWVRTKEDYERRLEQWRTKYEPESPQSHPQHSQAPR